MKTTCGRASARSSLPIAESAKRARPPCWRRRPAVAPHVCSRRRCCGRRCRAAATSPGRPSAPRSRPCPTLSICAIRFPCRLVDQARASAWCRRPLPAEPPQSLAATVAQPVPPPPFACACWNRVLPTFPVAAPPRRPVARSMSVAVGHYLRVRPTGRRARYRCRNFTVLQTGSARWSAGSSRRCRPAHRAASRSWRPAR